MKRVIVFSLFFLVSLSSQAQHSYAEKMAVTAMRLWADTLTPGEGRPFTKWSYDQAVILKGIEGLWLKTADKKYFAYMQKCMDFFVDDKGVIKTYKQEDYNIDNVLGGRILLTLYRVTGKEKYYKAAATLREQLTKHPRTNEGGFWHKKIYPYQMWLDGLYMGQPFYAEWATFFNESTTSYNDIVNQFVWMENHAREPITGLLYHGWDESKQQQWANKTTGTSPNFWARAMGWYGMALVDVLEQIPASFERRKELVKILERFTTAIRKVQDKKTGLWYDVLDKPTLKPNYLEASASCMLTYTIAKGVRLGDLKKESLSIAQTAYNGILQQFIETDANGFTNLKGTVGVSGLGGKPYRDGSFEYYMSEKVVINDPKGVGAFIQAANEVEAINQLQVGKGKTILLDHYYNAETQKDITGVEKPFHYVWEERDNNGFSLLGDVCKSYGLKLNTLYTAPTFDNLKNASIYCIVDADVPKENPNPNYMTEADATVIFNWVKAGGVLLLLHNDKGNAEFDKFNMLSKKFGITFNENSRNKVAGTQFEMGALQIPNGHSIFKTARKVYLKEISTLSITESAKSVFTDKGDTIMAMSKVGKGIVFAVGDPWLYNEYVDGRKLPADFENFAAANDLIKWLILQTKK